MHIMPESLFVTGEQWWLWLFCAVTSCVRCMVRTTILNRWRISATGSYP